MHSTISYKDEPNADEKAVADIREWCSEEQWLRLCEIRDEVLNGNARFSFIVIALDFMGVRGFPVHAFGRTFCPVQWQAWYDKLPD